MSLIITPRSEGDGRMALGSDGRGWMREDLAWEIRDRDVADVKAQLALERRYAVEELKWLRFRLLGITVAASMLAWGLGGFMGLLHWWPF